MGNFFWEIIFLMFYIHRMYVLKNDMKCDFSNYYFSFFLSVADLYST